MKKEKVISTPLLFLTSSKDENNACNFLQYARRNFLSEKFYEPGKVGSMSPSIFNELEIRHKIARNSLPFKFNESRKVNSAFLVVFNELEEN